MSAVRHRETVLTELVKARGEQGLNGVKIAVVGIGGPKSYEKAAKEEQPATGAAIKVKADRKSKQLAYAREQERRSRRPSLAC